MSYIIWFGRILCFKYLDESESVCFRLMPYFVYFLLLLILATFVYWLIRIARSKTSVARKIMYILLTMLVPSVSFLLLRASNERWNMTSFEEALLFLIPLLLVLLISVFVMTREKIVKFWHKSNKNQKCVTIGASVFIIPLIYIGFLYIEYMLVFALALSASGGHIF